MGETAITALVVGFVQALFFYLIKRSIEKNDENLTTTLSDMKSRDNEQGKRLHDLETGDLMSRVQVEELVEKETQHLKEQTNTLTAEVKQISDTLNKFNINLTKVNTKFEVMLTQTERG